MIPVSKEEKIYYWGHQMWWPHWIISILLFIIYVIPTILLIIFRDVHWGIIVWGFTFGFIIHIYTPMIIKYRKLYKNRYVK